jgi:hypothetical protein
VVRRNIAIARASPACARPAGRFRPETNLRFRRFPIPLSRPQKDRSMKTMIGLAAALSLIAYATPAFAQTALPEGMRVELQTRDDISSKTARKGDRVELVVARPVAINGVTLIPAGAPAVGEITKASDNGLLGRSGKLDIEVREVSANGRHVPVRGAQDAKGKSGTLGAVGAGVVFLPLAVVVKGREAKIPAGTKVDVYVDQTVQFSDTGLQSDLTPPESVPPPAS